MKEKKKEKELAQVPFFVYEMERFRAEKAQRRLLKALLLSMVVNAGCITRMVRKGI